MNKKILIIILAIVVLGGGAFAYITFFSAPPPEPDLTSTATYYTPGEYIVTNLKGDDYLVKATIVLGLNETAEDTSLLDTNIAAIRDRIVYIFRSHTREDFEEESSLSVLSQEIVQAVNQELEIDYVVRAYIYDFVIQ